MLGYDLCNYHFCTRCIIMNFIPCIHRSTHTHNLTDSNVNSTEEKTRTKEVRFKLQYFFLIYKFRCTAKYIFSAYLHKRQYNENGCLQNTSYLSRLRFSEVQTVRQTLAKITLVHAKIILYFISHS